MSLQVYSIVFFVIFIAVLSGIAIWSGLRAKRRGSAGAAVEYYLAGRTTPWFVLAFAYITSSCSAGAFIGDVGVMGYMGFPYYWYLIAIVPAMVIPAVFLMRKMRLQAEKLGSLSIPEYLGDRYKSPALHLIIAILVVICYLFVLVSQFKGAAVLMQQFFGISFTNGLIIITVIICFFVIIGGLNSVAWTDFAQGIPMLVLAFVVLVASFIRVGGFSGAEAGLAKIDPKLVLIAEPDGPGALMNVKGIIGTFAFWFIAFVSQPYLCSHFLALPNVTRKTVGKFLLLSLVLALAFNAFCLVGLAGRVMFPNVEPDYLSATVVADILPPLLAAFCMIGFFCAILTTATSILLTIGQSIGRDIYSRINKKATPKQEVLVTRISVILIAMLIVFFNMVNPPKFLSLFMYMGLGGIGCCVGIPLIAAIASKRATREGALAAAISGPVVYLIMNVVVGENYLWACFVGLLVSAIMMLAVSALTRKNAIGDTVLEDTPAVASDSAKG